MSKKKASNGGSTMTLKDFHGGSIPSDLPLPSGPGVSVRPGFDRQIRSSRPGTAYRGFDDRPSLLSYPVHIGGNFNEDERKPLNGVSMPRRTISDEIIRSTQRSPEVKLDSEMPSKFSGGQISVNSQNSSGNAHRTVPNAWGIRKEVRFEQVSSLQKVSSRRWQSNSKHVVEDGDLHSKGQTALYPDSVRPARADDKYDVSQLQPSGRSEVLERPKLKLLPRSKLLQTVELPATDYKLGQGYQQPNDSAHVVAANELYGNGAPGRPSSAGINCSSRAEGRPKLNVKPRTQLLEQSEGNLDSERKFLFGGARPRELVLKERGIDDAAIRNLDTIESPKRVEQDLPQTFRRPEIVVQTAHSAERLDKVPVDQRTGRDPERKHQRGDMDKADMHSSSWRKDSWRNVKGTQKQQQQIQQRPEPETWRKPVEQLKLTPTDVPGLRYGKAASPLELAQAFSRPISSSTKTPNHFSSHKGLPGRNQVPFSRLTATPTEPRSSSSPRHKINGN